MRTYARILRVPALAPLLVATLVGRLPIGINGLAIVLFLREQTGSFAVAGAVAGSLALGNGLGAPLQGRVVDRLGHRVLVPLAAGHAAGLLAMLALGRADAPTAVLLAAGTLTGLALPPVSSVLRAQYPVLLRDDEDLVPAAFALDSVLIEIIFIAGPLLTGALVAIADPAAALLVSAAAALGGTIAFVAALPARERAADRLGGGPLLGALASPGIQTLVLSTVPVGFTLGALEVALPAFADEEGSPELAGVLIAVWSLASAVGGLAYGARPRRAPLAALHLRLAFALPLGVLPLALAPSPATALLLVLPAGMFVAPLIASRNELVGAAAPEGTETEAYTWPLTALVAGVAAGAAVSGALADGAGWQASVLAAAGVGVLGGAVAAARRGTLARAGATSRTII